MSDTGAKIDALEDLLESLRMGLERIEAKEAGPGGTLLEALAREVLALRTELADLRQQLATEVRTRRLVVVTEDGFESIVAETRNDYASVKVICHEDPDTWATIHADEQDGVSAGVYLSGDGNGVGMFEVHRREHALGTEDEVVSYNTYLCIDEDHGPGVTLNHEGLDFRR